MPIYPRGKFNPLGVAANLEALAELKVEALKKSSDHGGASYEFFYA